MRGEIEKMKVVYERTLEESKKSFDSEVKELKERVGAFEEVVELEELLESRLEHYTEREEKAKERVEELMLLCSRLEGEGETLRKVNDELRNREGTARAEERLGKSAEENMDYVREVQRQNNQHLTEVITGYEKKLANLIQQHKSEKRELEKEKVRLEERVKFREQVEVTGVKEEIAELRKQLQDCERNLFKTINGLKESKVVICRLKEKNEVLVAENLKLRNLLEGSCSNGGQRLNKVDGGLDFGTLDIEHSIFQKEKSKIGMDKSVQVQGDELKENPFQTNLKDSEDFAQRKWSHRKTKSTTPGRQETIKSSVMSKNTAYLMEEDSALQLSRSRDTEKRDNLGNEEKSVKKVSFFDIDKENNNPQQPQSKYFNSLNPPLQIKKKQELQSRKLDSSKIRENSLLRLEIPDKYPSGDKFRASSKQSNFLDKQRTSDPPKSSKNPTKVELQISDLLYKIGRKQKENKVKESKYDPFKPSRTHESSYESRRKKEGMSDRGFLNFYRENSKTSSFIMEENQP